MLALVESSSVLPIYGGRRGAGCRVKTKPRGCAHSGYYHETEAVSAAFRDYGAEGGCAKLFAMAMARSAGCVAGSLGWGGRVVDGSAQ